MTKPLPWMTSDILAATRGELACGDPQRSFSQIGIDSRTISPDSLFVAIVGNHHDGHSFVVDLIRRGLRGIVINKRERSAPVAGSAFAGLKGRQEFVVLDFQQIAKCIQLVFDPAPDSIAIKGRQAGMACLADGDVEHIICGVRVTVGPDIAHAQRMAAHFADTQDIIAGDIRCHVAGDTAFG